MDAILWLSLNLLSLIIMSFYSMMEMACVSFNRVRLHYYVEKKHRRAMWINYLLHHPSRLFGTTLLGVNVAMFFGSECARQFHSAIGLDPDLAPLTQVIIVVIFGELAPMFAARSYPEQMALLGIPFVYASAKLMKPVLWVLKGVSTLCNWIIGGKETEASIYLTQEELVKIVQEQEEDQPYITDSQEFNIITSNIFTLKHKIAGQIMTSLNRIPLISSNATVQQARELFQKKKVDYIPIYHNDSAHIVGVAFPRDLIRAADSRRVRDHAKAPWFLTRNTKLSHILQQFKRNNQEVAIILDDQGHAQGLLDLDDVIEEIFGKQNIHESSHTLKERHPLFIDRTFPADLKIRDFNTQFGVILSEQESLTLAELMTSLLGHQPEEGESVFIAPFELTVEDVSLRGVKTISIVSKV